MSSRPYIRSISDKVSKYTRNSNEILRNELLYNGAYPNYADPADYHGARLSIKAVRLG